MQDEILRDLKAGIDNIVVFCDLSNAFDLLSHQTILDKLRVYGFTEATINWYTSYLKDRAQFIGLGGAKSSQKRINKRSSTGKSKWIGTILDNFWRRSDRSNRPRDIHDNLRRWFINTHVPMWKHRGGRNDNQQTDGSRPIMDG